MTHPVLPRRLRVLTVLVAAGCALGLVPAGPAAAESTGPTPRQLVSRIGSAGVRQSEIGPGRTDPGSVDGDGDVVAFTTPAGGPGDTNGTADVYVRDRRAGTTTLVSARPGGGAAALGGRVPSISTDGRYVSFVSESPDLVPGDSGATNDVFVRDRVAGTTTRINVEPGGARAGTPITAVISPDGKVVAWQSSQGIWVRSWKTGATVTRVLTGTSPSIGISLSGDGRYLAYVDTDGTVVRRDRTHPLPEGLVAASATPAGDRRPGRSPAIDVDGTTVAFLTAATDLRPTPVLTAGPTRMAIRRFAAGDTGVLDAPVTAFAMGSAGVGFAIVTSAALVAEDADTEPDVYALHASLGGQLRLVSEALPPTPSTGAGRPAWNPEVSGDGLVVTLVSSAVVTGSGSSAPEPRRWAVSALPRIPSERGPTVAYWFDAAHGRAATAAERSAGEAAIASLAETDFTLVRSYLRAPAWAEPRGLVVRLYEAYYLRPPDLAGYDYWVGRRLAGMTPEAMSAAFAGTPEFRTMYGTLTNRQFVDRVYRNVLERAARPADLDYWAGELDAGRRNRGQVMLAFSETGENTARTAVRVDVVLLLRTAKDRVPGRAELDEIDAAVAVGFPPTLYVLLAA